MQYIADCLTKIKTKSFLQRILKALKIKNILIKYAAQQGWSIYKIYSDDDFSGLDNQRPAWNEMIKDAKERKFNIILCKSQSRFTRDMEVVEKYLHNKFIEWGIRFIGLTDNSDTLNKGNKNSVK